MIEIILFVLGTYCLFVTLFCILAKVLGHKTNSRNLCDKCKTYISMSKNKQKLEFTEWFAILTDELKHEGFHDVIDHHTAMNDYDIGIDPLTSAKIFIKTMRDDS